MFRAIGLVLSWLPTIVAVVTAIEQIVGDGSGEDKKKVALQAIYRVISKAGIEVTGTVKTIISAVVDATVAVLNLLGVSGFRDTAEQEPVELLSAAHVQEVAALDAELEAQAVEPEVIEDAIAKAMPDEELYPNDARLDELEATLTQE